MTTLRDALPPDEVLDQVRARYRGLVQSTTWGERILYYSPSGALSRGAQFVTVTERDSADDAASRLDETGSYRLGFALAPDRYAALFGTPPIAADDGIMSQPADVLVPHPRLAPRAWAAIVNPTARTLARLWPLLDESYALAREACGEAAVPGSDPGV